MKVQTLSIVVGDSSCNARCPFCVSKMTPKCGVDDSSPFNVRNLKKAAQLAKDSGVSTVLITGKGEPLLKKNRPQLLVILSTLLPYSFPIIEIQTNGTELLQMEEDFLSLLWKDGVTTFIISCVHYDTEKNKEVYNSNYPNLDQLVAYLHRMKFSVRLSCVLMKDYIDTVEELYTFTQKCKEWNVEQFTARPVVNVISIKEVYGIREGIKREVYDWTNEHLLPNSTDNPTYKEMLKEIRFGSLLKTRKERAESPTLLLELMHGATVFDYDGQNVCMGTCLTQKSDPNEIRQLIYFPDGHLRYDWKLQGAIIF